MSEKTEALIMAIRAALLAIVDALEVYAEIERTRDIRKAHKKRDYENYAGAVQG